MDIEPSYPFATDPRPTTGHGVYDELSLRLGIARAIASKAMRKLEEVALEHPKGTPKYELAMALAKAAARSRSIWEGRWVDHAFVQGQYNDSRPVLP